MRLQATKKIASGLIRRLLEWNELNPKFDRAIAFSSSLHTSYFINLLYIDNGRLNAQELVAASAILSAGGLDRWAAKTESTQKRPIQFAFSLENRPIDESPVVADKKV